MFIFDFVAETILDQILDWIYGKIIGFLNDFFVMMNNMGVELFALPWVEAVKQLPLFLVTSDGHCLVSDLW